MIEHSFPPIAEQNAKHLILGSMPSVQSLKQQQYYANPRNAFWQIMAELLNFDIKLPYQSRGTELTNHQIAVWDVLQSCQRQGSLDSNIEEATIIANDFTAFLNQYSDIHTILFNGAKAEQIFNRHVLPNLSSNHAELIRKRLPSTSPAHASMKFEQKMLAWKAALLT